MKKNVKLSASDIVQLLGWRGLTAVITLWSQRDRRRLPAAITEARYGALPRERLDVIEPAIAGPAVPIVFIHGGAWVCGQKEQYYSPLAAFVQAGFRIFNVEYPRAPEDPHPQPLRSLLGALAWIRARGIERVQLVGDSAGGNLAMMLGILMANDALQEVGLTAGALELPQVVSIVSLYGVLERDVIVADGFPGGKLFLKAYSPASSEAGAIGSRITPMELLPFDALPRTLIAAGNEDRLVRSSRIAAEALRHRFGGHVTYTEYAGADHGFFQFGARSDELRRDVTQFLLDVT
ncbi:MAG TPA: alpha/beta hydrolase [Kouleothrix sp.]|uniref:alpha/beta hydrolase n=1 Tax=Kouleothrix sp. TaxID=2779161 RepID=UPI002BEC4706|nr:alpha/beta hydrolase [Kouleothrix sp.]